MQKDHSLDRQSDRRRWVDRLWADYWVAGVGVLAMVLVTAGYLLLKS